MTGEATTGRLRWRLHGALFPESSRVYFRLAMLIHGTSLSKRDSDSPSRATSGGGASRGRRAGSHHRPPSPSLPLLFNCRDTGLYVWSGDITRWKQSSSNSSLPWTSEVMKECTNQRLPARACAYLHVCVCVRVPALRACVRACVLALACACCSGSQLALRGAPWRWHRARVLRTPECLRVPCWHHSIVFFYPLTEDKWPRYRAY